MVCVSPGARPRARWRPVVLVLLAGVLLTPGGQALPDEDPASDSFPLVKLGADGWRALDGGEHPGADWTALAFDDSAWKSGAAPLGYGDDDIVTELSYGEDESQKHPVYWFRRKFVLESLADVVLACGRLVADDGAVVFLNGHEVVRANAPAGDPAAATWAPAAFGPTDEREPTTFLVEPDKLVEGENVIAVQLHQANRTSSDLALDLELLAFTDEEAVRRLRADLEAREQQEEQERVRVAALQAVQRQGMIGLQDGEYSIEWFDGIAQHTQTMVYDAVEQAKEQYGIAFVRVYAGDTLEKVAAQSGVPVARLRALNRLRAGHVYGAHDFVCTDWRHTVRDGETIERIAATYQTTPEALRELNRMDAAAPAIGGTEMLVPALFLYTAGSGRDGSAMLQLPHGVVAGRAGGQGEVIFGGIDPVFIEAMGAANELQVFENLGLELENFENFEIEVDEAPRAAEPPAPAEAPPPAEATPPPEDSEDEDP